MKWFCHIFCLYLFVLSCVPCSDGEHGHEALAGSGEPGMYASHQEEDTHGDCTDSCTPFCVCACCGSVVSNYKAAATFMKTPAAEPRLRSFTYHTSFSNGHLSELLRPPIHHLG